VKDGFPDSRSEALRKGVDDLGIMIVIKATSAELYLARGTPEEAQVDKICQQLLADCVVERYFTKKVSP